MPWVKKEEPKGQWVKKDPAQGVPPALAMARDNPINKAVNYVGTGLTKALAGAAGLPGDLMQLVGEGHEMQARAALGSNPMAEAPFKSDYSMGIPKSKEINDYIFGELGVPEYKPTSAAGRVGQSALAALVPGGARTAITSLGAGAGMGIAQEASPDNVPLQVGAALAGGFLVGAPTLLRKTTSGALRDATKGMTDADFEAAAALQRSAASMGAPITAAEATGNPQLLMYQRMAEASPQGAPLRTMMTDRPGAVRRSAKTQIDAIGGTRPPQFAVKATQKAAEKSVKSVEAERTKAVSPLYEKAATQGFPSSFLKPAFDRIDEELAKVGTESAIGRDLVAYRRQLEGAIDGRRANVGPLDTLYKETRDRANPSIVPATNPNAITKERMAVLGPVNDVVGQITAVKNPSIKTGRTIYQEKTPAVIDAQQSKTGDLARSKTYKDQVAIMADSDTVRPSDINKIATDLAKSDPAAFRDWSKLYLSNTLNKSLKETARGQNAYAGQKYRQLLIGTPQQKENIKTMFLNLPNGQLRWQAFQKLLDVFEAQGRRMPFGSPTQGATQAAENLGRVTVPLTKFGVQSRAADAFGRWRMENNLEEIADIFTSDSGVERMKTLVRLEPSSRRAQVVVGGLLGMRGVNGQ